MRPMNLQRLGSDGELKGAHNGTMKELQTEREPYLKQVAVR